MAHAHAFAPTRPRTKPLGDEEASAVLNLGEFTNVPSLSLSEARLLINTVMEHRRKGANVNGNNARAVQETETLAKTMDYLDMFARFKQNENITAVERLLAGRAELEPFERSQLGSLCCETSEEAKMLIPSLEKKISNADLEDLLKEITNLRAFVE